MKNTPEDLIIGFPIICKLKIKLCTEFMEAEFNNKNIKIPYCNKQNLLLVSTKPIIVKPAQIACLTVNRTIKNSSVITDINNLEHMPYSVMNNTLKYTNFTDKPIVLYPGSIVASIEMDSNLPKNSLEKATIIDPSVPRMEANMFQQLVKNYSQIIDKSPGKYSGDTKMKIDITSLNTFKSRVIPIPFAAESHYREWIIKMAEIGVIEKSNSQYTSTLLAIKKKEVGQFRYVLDCSSINSITKLDFFPIPKLIDIMRQVAAYKVFIVCDVSKYFDSLPLDKDCKKYFSFICPMTQQIYSFTTVVQGSRNASFHSQRVLRNEVLNGIDGCISFIDDIIIYANTHLELFDIFTLVLQRFKQYNLHLQPQKLLIGPSKINMFGYNIHNGVIKGEEKRLIAVSDLPYPKNKRELFKFLGSLGYYRIITPNYATTSCELNKMLSMNIKFEFSKELKTAFDQLKKNVKNSIGISLPHEDGTFILNTDASNDSFGATLASRNNKDTADIRIIGLEGGSFLPTQRRYNIAVKELLALSKGVDKFRHFLLGNEFIIKIDNSSIYHILNSPNKILVQKTGPVSRILLQLQEFSFTAILVKTDDISHVLVDMLSRGNYLKVQKVTAEHLLVPEKDETISTINYFPMILSQGQLWEIIKKSYLNDQTHSRTIEKYKKIKGFQNFRTHCTIAQSIIVPEAMEQSILELTHLCSAKKHLWFMKSKRIWMKNMAEKISTFSLKCERCQKFVIKPIKEKFIADKLNGDYPFQIVCCDFSIIHNFNKGILIFTCPNSKFTFATLSTFKSSNIATAIMGCFMRYGISGSILKVDNQFNTTVIKQMAELMQIQIEFSTPRNSRSNSLAELAVKKVQKYLRLIAPDFDNEDEVVFAVELACLLINTEIREDVSLTPLEIVFPHASFTPFALENIELKTHPGLHEYINYIIKRLQGVYDIGKTDDITKSRIKPNQPLEVGDLVRVKLENTERANKLSPYYSEHVYRITVANEITNTYVIIRIDTEEAGIRSKRFLYHRRKLKKIEPPNERLIEFWKNFPNSADPLRILKKAINDKIFEETNNQNTESQEQNNPTNNDNSTSDQNNENSSLANNPSLSTRQLRPRKIPNYKNLTKS